MAELLVASGSRRISALTLVSGISGSTAMPIVMGGNTVQVTHTNFLATTLLNQSNTFSGNNTFGGQTTLLNGLVNGDLVVKGDLTANQYIISSSVSHITSSFSSGSTIFGDSLDDTHQFTGSVSITGSFLVNGIGVDGSSINAFTQSVNIFSASVADEVNSLQDVTASYVLTSSLNAYTASNDGRVTALTNVFNSYTASNDGRVNSLISVTGSYASTASLNAYTASNDAKINSLISVTGSYATTGSNIFVGNQTITGSLNAKDGGFSVSSGSGFLTSSLAFTHNTISPTQGYSLLTLRHINNDFNENFALKLFADDYIAKIQYEQNNVTYDILRTNLAGDVHLTQNTRLFGTDLTIDGALEAKQNARVTGSLVVSGSGVLIGNQTITGSLIVSGSSTFTNIGLAKFTGSVGVSGSVNADSFTLDATSTSNIPALNSTFNLDLSGSGEYGGDNFIKKTLVLGDGKILIAGRFQSIDGHTTNDIARLNSNGTIDTGFTSPIFGYTFGGDYYGYINTFVTQSDNKILVGGTFDEVDGGAREGIARLNANGSLDSSFAVQSWSSFAEVKDIAIQNDGKIVCVGYFTSGSRRINTDGTLDTSFNVSTGSSNPSFFNNDYFYSVALLNSGSEQAILIGGEFQQWGSFSDYNYLVKLNPSGSLDFGFAGTNLDIATIFEDRIQKIKVGDDGYVYVAGRFRDTGIGNNAGFARITTVDEGNGVGAIDTGFRTYITTNNSFVNDFDFYNGDKILLGGSFTLFGNPSFSVTSANRFVIIDQNDGGLVSNWSSDGLATKYNLNTGSINSVTLLPNDNVLVGGTFTSASFPSTAREGLASLKLAGLGVVTTTTDYSITADTTQLLISSSNTYFSGNVNISGSITGSTNFNTIVNKPTLVSGSSQVSYPDLSNIPNGIISSSAQIDLLFDIDGLVSSSQQVRNYGIFATTGSNTFKGNQIVTGSLRISGSVIQVGETDGNIIIESGSISLGESSAFGGNSIAVGKSLIDESAPFSIAVGFRNRTNYDSTAVFGAYNTSSNAGQTIIGVASKLDNNIGQGAFVIGNGTDADNRSNLLVAHGSIVQITGSLLLTGSVNISGGVTASSFTGSFFGDGSGLFTGSFSGDGSGLTGVIETGSFAVTGSNTFIGNQIVTGSVTISGSISQTGVGDQSIVITDAPITTLTTATGLTAIGYGAGEDITSGYDNTFIGNQAGRDNNTGYVNTFVGGFAGSLNTSGIFNTFVGRAAGQFNTTGEKNTYIGTLAGQVSTGNYNTFLGTQAGALNTSAGNNTFIGTEAGSDNTLGTQNTFVGRLAGENNSVGNNNTILGASAGNGIQSGSSNTFVGRLAGAYIVDGLTALSGSNNSVFLGTETKANANSETNQIVIGHGVIGNGSNTVVIGNASITSTTLRGSVSASLFSGSFVGNGSGLFTGSFVGNGSGLTDVVETGSFATTGSNTFIGNQIVTGSVTISGSISQVGVGDSNIIIRQAPLNNLTTAEQNVIIGSGAGLGLTTGFGNTYIGFSVGSSNQTGNNQTFVGTFAGRVNTANENTFVGSNSGYFNTTGTGNAFFGYYAGYRNTTANNNTFIGDETGFNNTIGANNTFIGQRAGNFNSTAQNNTFVGSSAGEFNTSGSGNTFIGQGAGTYNTTANYNAFIGHNAGRDTSVGTNNTFVGPFAGQVNISGSHNTFIGSSAGVANTQADSNTFVGSNAGSNNSVGTDNTFVGRNAGTNTTSGSGNSFFGRQAAAQNNTGANNSTFGFQAGQFNQSGSNNTFFGKDAGTYLGNGSSQNNSADNSVFLGMSSRANGSAQTNQIVIGYQAIGNGSNTATLGNDSITDTYLKGTVHMENGYSILTQVSQSLEFANDAAAAAGGVPLGGLYRSGNFILIRLV